MKKISYNKEQEIQRTLMLMSGFFFILFFMIMGISGSIMNMSVMVQNGGKMPVLSDCSINTDIHFDFQNFDEVNVPYFADIINLRSAIFSIGDVIMLSSLACIFYTTIFFKIKLRRFDKEVKEKNE